MLFLAVVVVLLFATVRKVDGVVDSVPTQTQQGALDAPTRQLNTLFLLEGKCPQMLRFALVCVCRSDVVRCSPTTTRG